ncbi:hypothetical protein F4808DRAFT_209134 [Astrocystis sublimbata]|nr:hypothetical protein F4808DRAFT_209134 [Astrocystis sublimbata]
MKVPPLEVIKNWPRPNYINPESNATAGAIIGSLVLVPVTLVLAVRLYSRKRLTNSFGLDDLLICMAYIPAVGFTIAGAVTQGTLQWGRHFWDIEPEYITPNIQLMLITLFLFDLATSLTKLSMLAMVRRLTTASSSKAEGAAVMVLAVFITINALIVIIVEVFQCRPISAAWMLTFGPRKCINEEIHLMVANVINTLTDFVVVLLPIHTTLALDIPTRHRIVVISLFGIGLVASSIGIVRTYFSYLQYTDPQFDITWRAWHVWLASLLELHLGIICASVPATKPFFIGYLPTRLGLTKTQDRSLVISYPKSQDATEILDSSYSKMR